MSLEALGYSDGLMVRWDIIKKGAWRQAAMQK